MRIHDFLNSWVFLIGIADFITQFVQFQLEGLDDLLIVGVAIAVVHFMRIPGQIIELPCYGRALPEAISLMFGDEPLVVGVCIIRSVEEDEFILVCANPKVSRIVMTMSHVHPVAVIATFPPRPWCNRLSSSPWGGNSSPRAAYRRG